MKTMMNRYFKKGARFLGERKICLYAVLLCVFCFIAAGPVVPTDDLTSKSTVKNVGDLNLPYTPTDLDTTESTDPYATPLTDATGNQTGSQDVKIDWSKVPYISSKNPELSHAPDPVF
jgi:hypothetical protein